MGIIEEVGSEVRNIKKGDRVLAPFAFSDGSCEFCGKGLQTSCVKGGLWGTTNDGGQAEAVRAPFADGTLVVIPKEVEGDDAVLTAILPLTDVMATGHHAAVSADVRQGGTAVVVGDGAVGLCGVLAAKRLGADRIIIIGRHEKRLEIARRFGATDVVTSRDQQAIDEVQEMTKVQSQCSNASVVSRLWIQQSQSPVQAVRSATWECLTVVKQLIWEICLCLTSPYAVESRQLVLTFPNYLPMWLQVNLTLPPC
jgi:threonine dehydrogenase-like Zn-dependent dehydrogenase